MALKTGKVIIAKNIKLDKGYKDVLDYTEAQMLALVNANKVNEALNCSFIRIGENIIDTPFSYNDALKCNYLAMQNPFYSNKWFFAFIDSVEYISDGNSRIHYTIDEFATWYDYWNPKECFVIREHVNDDTVGLHTVPEDLELGEYAIQNEYYDNTFNDYVYLLNASVQPSKDSSGNVVTGNLSTDIGNYAIAGNIYVFPTIYSLTQVLLLYSNNGLSDNINTVWLVPKALITNFDESILHWQGQSDPFQKEFTIDKDNTLFGYTPKNKKLLTYPYKYLLMSNNAGSSVVLNWEGWAGNQAKIQYWGIPSVGGSIFAFPTDYYNASKAYQFGLMGAKFPTLSWSEDSYTNWLTQNAVNLGIGIAQDALQVVSGIGMIASGEGALAGAGMLANTGVTIASQVAQVYQHSLVPVSAKGNINGGDILTAMNRNCYIYYGMSIRPEYAKICDNYLTRKGYKVNVIKKPNQNGRPYFNFVQIGSEENIGYSTNVNMSVPASSMDIINNIYRNGVTIWHSHDNLGNYNLDNSLK